MKSSPKIPAIAAAAVIVLIAATILMREKTGVSEEAAAPHPAAEAPAQLETVSTTPAQVRSNTDRTGMARAEAFSVVQEQMERRTQMRLEQRERTGAALTQSMERYAAEPIDPAWAAAKSGQLTAIANQPEFKEVNASPTSLSVDCRSSMCRLAAQFDNRVQAESWIMMYTSSVGGEMPSSLASRSQNEDGSFHVEIYGRAR